MLKKWFNGIILSPVYIYRYIIKPYLPMACRFEPSCSAYTIESIQELGVLKGGYKSILRLLRCHPWCTGGFDPVLNHNENECKKNDRY